MKSKFLGTLAVFMALGNIFYCMPLPAHAGESEASSEAGLYAPTVARGRRRGYHRGYNQQPQPQSTYLTSTGAPMTPGPGPGQGQGRRHGSGQGRGGQHAQVRNYGAGRANRQQQNGYGGVQNTGIPVQSSLPGNPTTRTSTP